MKLQYKEVLVSLKDNAASVCRTVPTWEVPILEAIHNDVRILRDVVVERPAPSSDAEYDRLAAAYGDSVGDNGDKGQPYIAVIYGQLGAGRAALRTAMQAAVLPAETEVTPPQEAMRLNAELARSLLTEVAAPADADAELIG